MANNMGNALIDRAIQVCGSPAEAARRLGVSRVVVHEVQHGKKQMSPELAVLCAELIGADPYREAAVAMVANCKDPEKADRLNRAFHLPRLAGGAVMLLIFVIGGLVPTGDASAKRISDGLTIETLRQLWCRARTRAKDWKRAGFRLSGNAFRASRHYLRPQTLEHLEPGFCLDGARSRYRTV